jgi:hypothetical protein
MSIQIFYTINPLMSSFLYKRRCFLSFMSNLYTIFTQLRGLDNIQGVFCFKGNYVSADSFIAFMSNKHHSLLFLYISTAYLCSGGAILSLFSCFSRGFKASFLLFVSFGGSCKVYRLARPLPPYQAAPKHHTSSVIAISYRFGGLHSQ